MCSAKLQGTEAYLRKKKVRKIQNLPIFLAGNQSGISVMLSSKVNGFVAHERTH